jgi:hypothetical protein
MSEKPEQYKAEAEINLIHECGLLKLTNRREFLALPMEQRRELLSEQVAIIRQALPQYCDSAYDGHSTMEPDQPKSPELLSAEIPFQFLKVGSCKSCVVDTEKECERFPCHYLIDNAREIAIKSQSLISQKVAQAVAKEMDKVIVYATDYYSLSAGAFRDKYPNIETEASDGQWIASFIQQLRQESGGQK